MTYKLISAALLGALLIGCGGGGGGSSGSGSNSSSSESVSSEPVSAMLTQTLYHTEENSLGFIALQSSMENVDFEIAGGADAALFNIDSAGVLAFVIFPDYENPADANGDGSYEVVINLQADNGSAATQSDVTIVVDDVDEGSAEDNATLGEPPVMEDENSTLGEPPVMEEGNTTGEEPAAAVSQWGTFRWNENSWN